MNEPLKVVVDSLVLLLGEKARDTSDPAVHRQALDLKKACLELVAEPAGEVEPAEPAKVD